MQRRHAGAIQRVGVRANRDQVLDDLDLFRGKPPVGVGGVMKRLCSSAVLRSAIGSTRNQELRDRAPKCRRGHMQRRIAGIEVMSDFREEE